MSLPDSIAPDDDAFANGDLVAERFRIDCPLGRGGMGTVYKAYDIVLGRYVAFKTISIVSLADEELVRFQREARVACTINHPNVIAMLDFGLLPSKQPYMVMEFVDGSTIEDLILESRFKDVEFALDVIEQVCEGMSAVHRANIVHRDLKSSNIMVVRASGDGTLVKIVDFGIAKSLGQDMSRGDLTSPGQIYGTPHYMSPEQACGGDIDRRSDIYSLGCIIFEMLTGKTIFEADTSLGVIQMHTSNTPPRLSEVDCQLDLEDLRLLEPLVARAVAKSPDSRFQSMEEMKALVQELKACKSKERKLKSGTNPVDTDTDSKTSSSRSIFMYSALVAAVLAIAAIGGKVVAEKINLWANDKQTSVKLRETGHLDLSSEVNLLDNTEAILIESGLLASDHVNVTDYLHSAIASGKQIHSVFLKNAHLTEEDGRLISILNPSTLRVGGSTFDLETLRYMTGGSRLQYLNLDFHDDLSKEKLELLCRNPSLQILSLRNCSLDDADMRSLSNANGLHYLLLANNPAISEKGLKALKKHKTGMKVEIGGTAMSNLDTRARRKLSKSLDLLLDDTYMDHEGLSSMVKFMNLEGLRE